MTETCYLCEGEAVLVREPKEIRIGQRSVVVDGEFMRCVSCGEQYYLPGQMDAFQRAASDQIRAEDGLLSPDEIRAFRGELDLSQEQFEKLLGVGPKTVGRWERGTVFQSGAADTLIRVLRDNPETVQKLAAQKGITLPATFQAKTVVLDVDEFEPLLRGSRPMIFLRTGGAALREREAAANDLFAMSA